MTPSRPRWVCNIAWSAGGSLQWRHNGRNYVSNHQSHDCLLNRLFRCKSKKTSKLRVTGLCEGNSLVTGEFPAQRDSDAENVSIWWRHHAWHMAKRWQGRLLGISSNFEKFREFLYSWMKDSMIKVVYSILHDCHRRDTLDWTQRRDW